MALNNVLLTVQILFELFKWGLGAHFTQSVKCAPNLRYGKACFYNLAQNVLSPRKYQLFSSRKELNSQARAPIQYSLNYY